MGKFWSLPSVLGCPPGPGASLQSHKGLAGAESCEVISAGRSKGLGVGGWEGQPLPATAPHPSKDVSPH